MQVKIEEVLVSRWKQKILKIGESGVEFNHTQRLDALSGKIKL